MPYKDPEAQKRYFKEYREKNKVRRNAQIREWISKNKSKYDQYQAEYRAKNRLSRSQKSKECRLKKKSIYAEKKKLWRKNNPQWRKGNYIKNRDRFSELHRLSYFRHRKKRLEDAKRYADRNPHISVKRHAIRRLRISAVVESGPAVIDFIKLIRNSEWILCYYCKSMTPGKGAHIDHVVPLARGGSHASDNLCASCPNCNQTKHTKLISEWKREGQQLLSL